MSRGLAAPAVLGVLGMLVALGALCELGVLGVLGALGALGAQRRAPGQPRVPLCRAVSPRTAMPAGLFAPGAVSQDPNRVPQPHASCKATAVAGGRRCPPWDAAGAAAMGTADAL